MKRRVRTRMHGVVGAGGEIPPATRLNADRKWYILRDGNQTGPFTSDALLSRGVARDTEVWCKGMDNWVPIHDVAELRHVVDELPPLPSQIQIPRSGIGRVVPVVPSRLRVHSFIWVFLAFSFVGLIVSRIGFYLAITDPSEQTEILTMFGGIAALISLPGWVCLLILISRMWKLIRGVSTTTPGKAVGFLFVPLFNLYWIFVVFRRFADEFNAMTDRQALGDEAKISQGLATWTAVVFLLVSLLSQVPGLGELLAIAFLVITTIFFLHVDRKSRIADQLGGGSTRQIQRTR